VFGIVLYRLSELCTQMQCTQRWPGLPAQRLLSATRRALLGLMLTGRHPGNLNVPLPTRSQRGRGVLLLASDAAAAAGRRRLRLSEPPVALLWAEPGSGSEDVAVPLGACIFPGSLWQAVAAWGPGPPGAARPGPGARARLGRVAGPGPGGQGPGPRVATFFLIHFYLETCQA
jgi:hypothetical protein